jgi:hypothetical protein
MSDPITSLNQESAATDVTLVVRNIVGNDLAIDSVEVPREQRQGVVVLRGRLMVPSHVAFPRWLKELRPLGFTPMLRDDETVCRKHPDQTLGST